MNVRIIAAWPDRILDQTLVLAPGSRVRDAITHPQLDSALKALLSQDPPLGIFGERCKPEDLLADGDRIEIWRELLADPKEARRARARLKKEELARKSRAARSV